MACICASVTARLQPAGFSGRAAQPYRLLPYRRGWTTRCASTFPREGYTYLSQETVDRMDRELEEAREQGMQEYQELKDLLLTRTWRFGTLLGLYLFLAASAEAAFCELIGAGASYAYLLWLFKDVDSLQPGDTIYLTEAEKAPPQMQNIAKWIASYRHAIQPRLLVLVGLVAGTAAYNAAFPEQALSLVDQACLVVGFLAYKVALVQKVYDDLKPKPLGAEELMIEPRPMLAQVDDVDFPWKQQKEGKGEDGSSTEAGSEGEAAVGKGQ